MNVLTLLGAAAACKEFCNLLFDDPVKAATLLNITLTQGELKDIKETFTKEYRDRICNHLGSLSAMICRIPPCPFIPVIPGKEDFCKEAA